jgi:lipopolysaccharide/colanic/teichoic acid biosynthesis glycosyltransferase
MRYSLSRQVPRWKRWSDCLIATPLFIVSIPIVLLAIVAVRLTSSGPGIYTQVRLGLNRRRFTIYKIRTMAHDCEASSGPRWATARDSRITRIGRILRATHIDELPQLWNVIRGEMSLVGPRPERPEIVEKIEPLVPGYHQRLMVLPGVTGLAQVQLPPDSNVESVQRKVQYDSYYARNYSLWLDLRLIAVTAVKVVGLLSLSRTILQIPGKSTVEPIQSDLFIKSETLTYTQDSKLGLHKPDLTKA